MTSDELIAKYLEEDSDRGGPMEMRVKEYYIHVWALVGYLRSVDWDVRRTANDYELPVEAVEAANEFYKRHIAAIEARIAANSPAV